MRVQHSLGVVAALVLVGCGGSPDAHGFVAGADGGRLYYRLMGRGSDTVVVLHGGPGLHHRYLVPPLAPLTRRHTLVFYDQRGRGRSDAVADTLALSVEQDVADLEALRRALRLERLTLIGHGWGGAVGVRYALAYPGRVRRLALVSPFFPRSSFLWALGVHPYDGPDSAAFDGLSDARRSQRDRAHPRRFCHDYWGAYLSPVPVRDRYATRRLAAAVCDAPAEALAQAERVRDLTLRSLGAWDWRGELGAVTAPTLVLQGRGTVWRAAGREWLDAIPSARLIELPAHPQFPWLDEPGRFVSALDDFLSVTRPLPNRAGE
jgi:proline iminopeptidase